MPFCFRAVDGRSYGIENIIGNTDVFVIRLITVGLWDNGADANNSVAKLVLRAKTRIGKHVTRYLYVIASP